METPYFCHNLQLEISAFVMPIIPRCANLEYKLICSVRAPGEEGRRRLCIPLYRLNVLLFLDIAVPTQNFLHLNRGGPIPDSESLQLEDEYDRPFCLDLPPPFLDFPPFQLSG